MATTHHPDMKSSNSSNNNNGNCYGLPRTPSLFHGIDSLIAPFGQHSSIPGTRFSSLPFVSNLGPVNCRQNSTPSILYQTTAYQPYSFSSCRKTGNFSEDLTNTEFLSQPTVNDLSVNPFQDQTGYEGLTPQNAPQQFSPFTPTTLLPRSSNEEILDVGSYSPFGSPVDSDADGVDRTNQGLCSTSSAGYSSGYHSCEGSADNSPYHPNSVEQPLSSDQLHSPTGQPLPSYQESHFTSFCIPRLVENSNAYHQSSLSDVANYRQTQRDVCPPNVNPKETAYSINAPTLDTYTPQEAALPVISDSPPVPTLPKAVSSSLQDIEPTLPKITQEQNESIPVVFTVSTEEETPAKKTRVKYTPEQLEILEKAFTETPYPDWDEMEELSKKLDIAEQKIKVWFQNKRARWRKKHAVQQVQEVPSLKPLPPTSALYRFPASLPTYLPNSSKTMNYPHRPYGQMNPHQMSFNGQGFPTQPLYNQPKMTNSLLSEQPANRLPISQNQPPRVHQPTRQTPSYYQQPHTMHHGAPNVSTTSGSTYGHIPNSFLYPYM